MRLLESLEQEEIERIITELCADCGTWADAIIADHAVCAELNLYFAKANLAAKMHAFRPIVTDDGVLDLMNARHPLKDCWSADFNGNVRLADSSSGRQSDFCL